MTTKPVTRFAPSPTGYLHIGGARTALFNWLYAKAKGGTFLLRIEDTDRARSTPDAIRAIIDGLAWVGIDWSGEPLFQFARADRHRQIANELLAQGRAYHCYLTPQELEAMRANAEAEKRPPRIESPWRERDPREAPKGVKPALRLKAPREGETIIEDRVQGRVAFPNKDLEDLVILRSDGTPTYNLAVVVDDHDMGITHVIRGVEHLSNTPKQSQIYDAMGWARPIFAHVPLIHDAAGKKLSKRHGAAGVEEYRAMGYLPAALRNYLVRLGWSHGDDEFFSTEDLVRWFDIDGIGQSPARFDFAKLDNLNGHYIRHTADAELMDHIRAAYKDMAAAKPGLPQIDSDADWDKLARALPGLKERAKTLVEIVAGAAFIYSKRPLSLDEAARRQLAPAVLAQLGELQKQLSGLGDWSAVALEAAVRAFAEQHGLKLGKIAQPLRAALTGSTVSPPIFDVMAVLGREETLARLADQTKA
ncbi:MAG: glutamate--tRNA ligase [Hyphomicrobiaceae bacterium]|nr:MAG: glutamate--tRNA ligase [Hyphomicrobiaceae bacterium]